jgi:hypothetical protein
MNSTQILRTLSESEVGLLWHELAHSGLSWAPHYKKMMPTGLPLRHGSSIFVHCLHTQSHEKIEDHRHLFRRTIDSVADWTQNDPQLVARSYWHLLRPGDRIDVHRDRDSQFGGYFSKINRYQIFPKIPENFIALMDSELWNFHEGMKISNSLLKFNHHDWHYYANHSEEEIQFLVMDFFIKSESQDSFGKGR